MKPEDETPAVAPPFERGVGRLAPERAELAEQMGDEARKAMLLDPCKLTPALDAAVARYLKALGAQHVSAWPNQQLPCTLVSD